MGGDGEPLDDRPLPPGARGGYNGALRPPVVSVRDGDARVVVRRESYEDLLGLDVDA